MACYSKMDMDMDLDSLCDSMSTTTDSTLMDLTPNNVCGVRRNVCDMECDVLDDDMLMDLDSMNECGMKKKVASNIRGFYKYEPVQGKHKKYTSRELGVSNRVLAAINAPNISVVHQPKAQEGLWYVYGRRSCSKCMDAMKLLTHNGQAFYFLEQDEIEPKHKEWIMSIKPTNIHTIPIIVKDNKYFGVYDDLQLHFKTSM